MIEKKFIAMKKIELEIKEFIKEMLGKGKISNIKIERTPVGERIIIYTSKPGFIIGKKGEAIQDLTSLLKKKFALENPRLEIAEIEKVEFDAKSVADQIALSLERFGAGSFKIIAYKALERIKDAGALGAEIVLSGKLPSEKAKSWRFSFGYLQKTGEINIVNSAESTAQTKPGTIGVKVSIVPAGAVIPDRIELDKIEEIKIEEMKQESKGEEKISEEKVEKERSKKRKARKEAAKEKRVGEKNNGNTQTK
jgi:small subunit ribosomal protein S3